MNGYLSLIFIESLLLVSLIGVCLADESTSYVLYIQGGESSLLNGSDGMIEITVKDVVPEINVTRTNTSNSLPIEELTNISYPMDAALIFSGADNESTSMVRIVNLSLSDENNVLTLQVNPLQYYDGEGLKSFASKQENLPTDIDGMFKTTQIYAESDVSLKENSDECTCPDGWTPTCQYGCWCGQGYMLQDKKRPCIWD